MFSVHLFAGQTAFNKIKDNGNSSFKLVRHQLSALVSIVLILKRTTFIQEVSLFLRFGSFGEHDTLCCF